MHSVPKYIVKAWGPSNPLKITGVIYDNRKGKDGTEYLHNRYIHDAVYGHVSKLDAFKSELKDTNSWVHQMVDIKTNDPKSNIYKAARRVAYISRRYRANASSLYNLLKDRSHTPLIPYPFEDDEVAMELPVSLLPDDTLIQSLRLLKRMFFCTPNQGVGNNLSQQYSCGQYRLCPWCRYEKIHYMFTEIVAELKKDMQVCVTHFSTPCDRRTFDVNSDPAMYEKAVKSACKGRNKGWLKDYVITLPYRVRTANYDKDSDDKYNLVWRTTVIALAEGGEKLQSPEEAFPKTSDFPTTFMSEGPWLKFPPTKAGLCDAFRTFAEFPFWMLSLYHDPHFVADALTTLAAGSRDRAVGHGF